MKSKSQIKRKLKQVAFRHRQRYVQKGLQIKPCNCVHNSCVSLKMQDRLHQIRVCSYQEDAVNLKNTVCDSNFGGIHKAQKCIYFESKNTPEQLKKDFDRKIGLDGSSVPATEFAKDYPDVLALLWVLGLLQEEEKQEDTRIPESENPEYLLFMSNILEV